MELKKVEGTCSLRMLMGNDAEVSNAYGIFRNRHSFSTWLRGEQAGNSGNLKAIQLQTGCRKYRNLRRYRRCGFRTVAKYRGNFSNTVRIMVLRMPKGAKNWNNKYS